MKRAVLLNVHISGSRKYEIYEYFGFWSPVHGYQPVNTENFKRLSKQEVQ